MEGNLSKQIASYVLAHGIEEDIGGGELHSVVRRPLEDESMLEVRVGMKGSSLEDPHPRAPLDIRYSERPDYQGQGNAFGTLEYAFCGIPSRFDIYTKEHGSRLFIPEWGIGPQLAKNDQETYDFILKCVYNALTGKDTQSLIQLIQTPQFDRPAITAPGKEISPESP